MPVPDAQGPWNGQGSWKCTRNSRSGNASLSAEEVPNGLDLNRMLARHGAEGMADGYFAARDGRMLYLFVRAPNVSQDFEVLGPFIDRVKAVAPATAAKAEAAGRTPPRVGLTGLPAIEYERTAYRIALGPPGRPKVLSVPTREPPLTPCAVSTSRALALHAEVCCAAHRRHKLESQARGCCLLGRAEDATLCRYMTRPARPTARVLDNPQVHPYSSFPRKRAFESLIAIAHRRHRLA